jgi:hypothetical protein
LSMTEKEESRIKNLKLPLGKGKTKEFLPRCSPVSKTVKNALN